MGDLHYSLSWCHGMKHPISSTLIFRFQFFFNDCSSGDYGVENIQFNAKIHFTPKKTQIKISKSKLKSKFKIMEVWGGGQANLRITRTCHE